METMDFKNHILACFFGSLLAVLPTSGCKSDRQSSGAANVPEEKALDLQSLLQTHKYVSIPLQRLKSGYLAVPVGVAEKELLLILDTGSPDTHFDPERTKKLRLTWRDIEDTATLRLGGATSFCEVEFIEIGSIRTKRLMIGSRDSADFNRFLEKRYSDPPIDGLLGGDVLAAHSAVLDYSNLTLYLLEKKPEEKRP